MAVRLAATMLRPLRSSYEDFEHESFESNEYEVAESDVAVLLVLVLATMGEEGIVNSDE